MFDLAKKFPGEAQQIFETVRARACADDEVLLAQNNHRASVFRVLFEHKFVDWEIVRKTDKAVLVNTAGGELWLPLHRFNMAEARHDQAGMIGHRCQCQLELDELLATLEALSRSRTDCYVEVKKAGSGPTDKSHKYKVMGKTLTLPISQIKELDGALMAPEWLIKEKLKISKDERVSSAVWLGWDAVLQQLVALAK